MSDSVSISKSTGGGPWILGLASSSHNGAACILRGNEIIVAIQEERLTHIKRAPLAAGRPSKAVEYCLAAAGLHARQLDLIVTCVLQQATNAQHDVRRNPQLA